MSKPELVEVSFVFRGKDALENSQALLRYLDSVEGIYGLVEGIRHFGGYITRFHDDEQQKIFYLDGAMPDDEEYNGEHDV